MYRCDLASRNVFPNSHCWRIGKRWYNRLKLSAPCTACRTNTHVTRHGQLPAASSSTTAQEAGDDKEHTTSGVSSNDDDRSASPAETSSVPIVVDRTIDLSAKTHKQLSSDISRPNAYMSSHEATTLTAPVIDNTGVTHDQFIGQHELSSHRRSLPTVKSPGSRSLHPARPWGVNDGFESCRHPNDYRGR